MNAPVPLTLGAKVDERKQGRIPLALPGSISVGDRALIETALAILPGTKVWLRCGPIHRPAIVRWRSGRRAGISFEHSLDIREVDEQIDRSHAIASRRIHHESLRWIPSRPGK